MSILRKPYEISVWDDVWSTDKFVEQRLGIIGSDKMQSQSRVIEPELTQNVNGTKKFSFKLYKRYKDNITGELIENPFYNWLANERKVKLNYDGTWYDFVIKNISEPSSNYLYTYQLEDANVQELSKNGFNFIFDAELENNLGTSQELAEKLLEDTDWTVDKYCDVPVQTIDEALVYLKVTKTDGVVATQIIDQSEENQKAGIKDNGTITIPKDAVILATYSSCTGRPHRFQFFYLKQDDKSLVELLTKDDNRFITNSNCQYYIDFVNPVDAYREYNNYTIPYEFETTTVVEYPGGSDVTLSSEFRGKRYGFTQQTQYIPGLERYVNLYKDADNKTYYGYEHTEYLSPILIQNLISGSQLKSTSGWVGTTTVSGGNKATVEAVYGKNPGANFVSSLEDIANGQYNENNDYASYIKITFPSDANAIVLNSGPHDNRRLIGNMEVGDQYRIDCEYYGTDTNLQFALGEYVYSSDGKYNSIDGNITFSNSNNISTVATSNYSKENFVKNSEVRLRIKGSSGATYYIKSISLYKVAYYTDSEGQQKIITPDSAITGNENTVDTTYYYIDASITPTSPDSVIPTTIAKTLTYNTYKPVYNEGGCKVRTVTAKESNYFNILQSIAETFGQWLEINVTHSEDGTRLSKTVAFRNYVGHNNYAGFKYGVNLKDIKRTYESKKLVTKLIVKQNSNEFAPNGFCTIARADANPTGENTIYDFQYFFNTGMMSARDYLETTYVEKTNEPEDSVQGYFPRIRDYNIQIQKDNDILLNLSKDLVQINAELEVATVGYEAALDGIEETNEQIRFLTGYNISELNDYLLSVKNNSTLSDEQKKQELQILERSDVKKAIQEYSVYQSESKKYSADKTRLDNSKTAIETKYNAVATNINTTTKSKENLHKYFFATYNRFIQEGTWISEDYVDDEKYYADALSVLYNSCYPKVAYDVNVIEISKLPGYEGYAYNLGDITFVEDKEFFGDDFRVEVSVTETTDNLDDPSKNKIKIQNFKDQFQDLFQKITATVQQTQYNTGSYEKAVALAEAGQERKQQFLTDALDGMNSRLAVAGQQTVVIDNSGITVTDDDTPSESIRMVGGAIMLSKQDANGEQKWTTGLTSDGVSANLITAGVINAGQIAIMNSDQPAFRWDTYGISAFDTTTYEGTTSGFNYDKFVRFDKNGIYGIDGTVNGLNWHPQDGKELDDINEKATFALTWDGLRVTGNNNVVAHIGKVGDNIINITQGTGENKISTFKVSNTGDVTICGNLSIGDGTPVETYVDTNISNAKTDLQEEINGAKDLINEIEGNLQSQIDGEITTWFYEGEPSLENAPAENWKDEENKQKHIDDLYYDTNTQYVYRWVKNEENRFEWVKITDKGIQDALEAASTAQSTADGKRRIFTGVPTVPYDVGDLWVNATHEGKYTNELLRCNSPKGSDAEFSIDDWEKASKYTDDTVANGKMDPTVTTGNYTWSFDTAKGMSMNQGETNVFKIDDKGLYIKGNGEFTGKITANEGQIGGCNITNGKLEISAVNIKDKLTADNIDASALNVKHIEATSGSIAGWTIKEETDYNSNTVGTLQYGLFGVNGSMWLCPQGYDRYNTAGGNGSWALSIGHQFAIDISGSIYANGGEIAGWNFNSDGILYSKSGVSPYSFCGMSGKNVEYEYLDDGNHYIKIFSGANARTYNNLDITKANFKVYDNGHLYASSAEIEGKITATSGEIGGCKITNGVLKISADTNITGTLTATKIAATEGTIGSQTYNWTIGEYGSYGNIYCGQSTMPNTSYGTTTNNVYIGTDGLAYVGSNVTTCLRGGAVWMYSNKYTTSIGYQMTQFLRNGTQVGDITIMSNQDVLSIHGTWKFMNDVQNYGGETQFTSDINLKNSIQDLPENYDIMFNQLQPVIFKYNNGTSGRYHTGFIAQQVDQAIQKAQIPREEFSAICIDKNDDNEETWYLRYSNFIPINTWQIQKLKARVTKLENKLNSLLQGENINETTNNI